jgi:hypothetical protein
MADMESEQMSENIINDNFEHVAKAVMPQPNKIPGSIVKAIVKAMAEIKRIEKDARNEHGKYNYASVDAIYGGVHEAMAKAGLVVLVLEDSVERLQERLIQFTFSFVLATEEDTWEDPRSRRTVAVQAMGSQSYAAGQSFAEKAFLRSLFKLQTGEDEESDAAHFDGAEADAKTKKPARKEPKRMEVADATAFLGMVKGRIRNSKDMGELAKVVDEHGGTVASLDEKFRAEVRAAYKAQETILTKSNGSA